MTRLDQFAAFAQQDQPFLVIDADQNEATGGVQHQGLDDLKPALAALCIQPGQDLRRIAARRSAAGSSTMRDFSMVRADIR